MVVELLEKLSYHIYMGTNKIGKKLKTVRVKLGLRQKDISLKSGISVNYYARIERDEENPTLETIEKILKVLKVKSSDILPF